MIPLFIAVMGSDQGASTNRQEYGVLCEPTLLTSVTPVFTAPFHSSPPQTQNHPNYMIQIAGSITQLAAGIEGILLGLNPSTFTVTLFKNGISTGASVTVPTGNNGPIQLATAIPVAVGDVLQFQLTTISVPAVFATFCVTCSIVVVR